MDDTRETTWASGFLMGLAIGGASAAAFALLYAPSSGQDARRYLSGRAREGRERAAAAVERGREILHEGRGALEHGRDVLTTAIAEGRDAYRDVKARELG